ncbi:peptidyl-prolyl cis-trans isomerase [Polymorphobacter glacialis]|uniref:Parvulin-like PPIase n=1 Tax=Sandarakinorhabdus glacialis TaxID=1614636 RepID=A0A917E5U6_9SPHN|nr:peptidylprolyl isomerase [Polymorphobacter glacialis]GGE07649.1 peptidyl-prolyl cis-trans isomerase [Polymorphobacter glacialis]
MISFIRRWLTSWPVIVLLGLVVVAFAVTGVGDPFGGGAPQGSVAKVGKKTITETELLSAFERVSRSARERNPAITQAELAQQGGVDAAAGQLIGQAAMEQLGAQAGLSVSNRAVGAQIAAIPAFQVGGKFDDATYRRVLAQQRITDRELNDGIHGDLVRQQLLTPVTAALGVPAGMAQPYAQLLVDEHRGAVALVPLVAGPAPTEAEITKFYADNKGKLMLPERRGFRHALIDSAAVAASGVVTDAQIAAAFAKDPARYGGAATRRLQQVVVPDEAKARAIAAAAATEGFAKAAERLAGFGTADITLGEQSQSGFAQATSAAVAAAAFAAPAGGITAPIKSDFGWHVVRVESVGAAGKSLAAARPAVEAELRTRAGEDAVAALVAKIEDGVEAGKSFADLAKENGLVVVSQAAVAKDGTATGAAPLAGPLALLADRAFRHEPGEGAAVEDLGEGRLAVIETMQILPSAAPPLAQVRELVTAGAARDKALKTARVKADAIVAAVKKGGNFAEAVAAQGLPPAQPLAGRRIDVAQQPQVPPVVQAFLSTPAGTVNVLPSPQGWVMIHADTVTKGQLAAIPGLVEAGRREIASQLPDEFASAFAAAAERTVGSRRNEAVIDAVKRRLAGTDVAQ